MELQSLPVESQTPSTSYDRDESPFFSSEEEDDSPLQGPTTYSEFGKSLEDIMPEPSVDPHLVRLKEFLDTEWGLPAVENQLRGLFQGGLPPISPPQRWVIPRNLDVVELIWQQTQSEKFIDEMWPCIQMLIGVDTCNTMWAAQTLTVLALFNIIRLLPIISGQ